MRPLITLSLLTGVFVACQAPTETPTRAAGAPPVVSGNLDRLTALDGDVEQGFTCELRLNEAGEGTAELIAELDLSQGNYIASPFSPDSVLGHFRFELVDGPVYWTGALAESPVPPLAYDAQLKQQVRWATGEVTYTQTMLVPEDEFKARGEVFFVLEPACTPRVLPFELWRDAGGLHLEQRPGC